VSVHAPPGFPLGEKVFFPPPVPEAQNYEDDPPLSPVRSLAPACLNGRFFPPSMRCKSFDFPPFEKILVNAISLLNPRGAWITPCRISPCAPTAASLDERPSP